MTVKFTKIDSRKRENLDKPRIIENKRKMLKRTLKRTKQNKTKKP